MSNLKNYINESSSRSKNNSKEQFLFNTVPIYINPELFFLDGRPYPAGEKYHIHPTKGPMVGAKHVPEVHAFLTFNRFEPQTSNQESPTTTSTLESGY